MQRNEIEQHEASLRVQDFRRALKLNQQQFSAEVMKCAVNTIARWETANPPPRGEALLDLAQAAERHNQFEMADSFERLFLDEVLPKLNRSKMIQSLRRGPGGLTGYVVCRFDTQADCKAGAKFLREGAASLSRISRAKK